MDNAFPVGRAQTAQHLACNVDGFVGRELAVLAQNLVQALALDVFHGDKSDSVGFAQIENPNHIAIRDLTSEDQFLLKRWRISGLLASSGRITLRAFT